MKKLYKVTMKTMVMAKNEDEAELTAKEGIEMSECESEVEEAIEVGYFEGWANDIPWNSDDNRTCKEVRENERTNF